MGRRIWWVEDGGRISAEHDRDRSGAGAFGERGIELDQKGRREREV